MSEPVDDEIFLRTNVITNPGPAYADEGRGWQGIPTVERAANGRLWVGWYGGLLGEDFYTYCMLVTSDDDGESWSGLKLVIDPDGDGPLRAFDSCLWRDPNDRMWFTWNQKLCNQTRVYSEEQERRWYLWAITSDDAEAADPGWSEPRRLCESVMLNKPVVLSNGDWLLLSSDWFWDRSARAYRSTDDGESWHHWGAAHVADRSQRSFDEHMIIERNDGVLWMLVRTQYGIGQSFSSDGGCTWSYVRPSGIGHVCARFFIRRLRSGRLLLVRHGQHIRDTLDQRSHLCAFLSEDDGGTWLGGLLLDERHGVSYPDGVEDDDGIIYIVHDFDRHGAKEIVMSRITEEDILAKEVVDDRSRLRMLVNKATGQNPNVPL